MCTLPCATMCVQTLTGDILRYVRSRRHCARSVRYDHSAKISHGMYNHCITGHNQWHSITQYFWERETSKYICKWLRVQLGQMSLYMSLLVPYITKTVTTAICMTLRIAQLIYTCVYSAVCDHVCPNFDRGYITICTITASLCTISEVRSLSEDIARYVQSLHHWITQYFWEHLWDIKVHLQTSERPIRPNVFIYELVGTIHTHNSYDSNM